MNNLVKKSKYALFAIILIPFNTIASSESKCLAEAIYHEARGESEIGKLAVAQVIINRTRLAKYPSTICGVVYQPGQFSWTKRARHIKSDINSFYIADKALSGNHRLIGFKATHFHNNQVNPRWRGVEYYRTIGRHVFYKDKNELKKS